MFIVAFLIGIYTYFIFLVGVFGLLFKEIIVGITLLFGGGVFVWWVKKRKRINLSWLNNKLIKIFVSLFLVQILINLIGTLGPELGFDALWYHLTLPKLYLLNHEIFFIPGGL